MAITNGFPEFGVIIATVRKNMKSVRHARGEKDKEREEVAEARPDLCIEEFLLEFHCQEIIKDATTGEFFIRETKTSQSSLFYFIFFTFRFASALSAPLTFPLPQKFPPPRLLPLFHFSYHWNEGAILKLTRKRMESDVKGAEEAVISVRKILQDTARTYSSYFQAYKKRRKKKQRDTRHWHTNFWSLEPRPWALGGETNLKNLRYGLGAENPLEGMISEYFSMERVSFEAPW